MGSRDSLPCLLLCRAHDDILMISDDYPDDNEDQSFYSGE